MGEQVARDLLGSEEKHTYGNDSPVLGKGEFYVHSDAGCTVGVTAS